MNIKKLLTIALMGFVLHETTQAGNFVNKINSGTLLYHYNKGGLINGDIRTFASNGITIVDICQNKYTTKDNNIYQISESGDTFLGYIEYEYLENLTLTQAMDLIESSGLWPSPATLFYDSYGISSFLQSYPLKDDTGYLVPVGINYAGQKNGKNKDNTSNNRDNTINVTIYKKVYGNLVS